MIPHFPQTKKLELSDQEDINDLIKNFPPYSDYNFVSLYSYDADHKVEVSRLFGNLILKFQDYLDLEMFYTFLGTNDVSETIKTLLQEGAREGLRPYLKLIPHAVVEHISVPDAFFIQEDRDNFDYVIDAKAYANLEGRTYHSKRKELNKFTTGYEGRYTFDPIDLTDSLIQKEMLELFTFWIETFDKNPEESKHEYKATEKLLMAASSLNLQSFGLRVDGKLVGYIIAEVAHNNYAVLQFGKWNMLYRGSGEYLQQQCIARLYDLGCQYINYEQDLGIEGLRRAKELCKPVFYLKKYRVALHQ